MKTQCDGSQKNGGINIIVLESNRLRVEICEPGESHNRTVRFDRAGFISRVNLDGEHEFCTCEPDNLRHPCSGGAGLCSEILDANIWAETPEKTLCPKFGVGLLRKPGDGPYQFFNMAYEVIPFEIDWHTEGTSVIFNTRARECMKYALHQTKTVTVEDNRLVVDYEMENVGEKVLALSEYVHNFITIDRLPIGPEYFLHFPTVANQTYKRSPRTNATIYGDGKGFSYSGYCGEAASMVMEKNEIDPDLMFRWILTHSGILESVSEEVSFIPERVNIWTIDHIISPEVFHNFSLASGERCAYTRSWVFGA
jgi:hypothetical protein